MFLQTEYFLLRTNLANPRLAQGDQARLMHETFNIATGFHGTLISAYARLNLDRVVDEVNNDTLDPWADLQTKAGISQSTPLTPFMEKELLRDMDLCLNGSLFEKETGFQLVMLARWGSRKANHPQIRVSKTHKSWH